MKRVVFIITLAIAAVIQAAGAAAQSVATTRSEQFVIDSLRVEAQYKMYTDSLNAALQMHHNVMSPGTVDIEPLVVCIAFFVLILGIVITCIVGAYMKKRSRYRVMEKAIEAGQPVPEALFLPEGARKSSPLTTLRVAFVLLGLGIGLLILAVITAARPLYAVAAVPMLIGAGYLYVYYLEEKRARLQSHHEVSDNE